MEKFTLLLLLGILSCVYAMRPGGISDTERVPTEDLKSYILKTSPDIKTKAAESLLSSDGYGSEHSKNIFDNETPEALAYKSQVVAGTNYFIKTRIGKFIFHVRMYRDLQGNVSIHSVTGPKKETAPIEYF